jgi:hypothetical protein
VLVDLLRSLLILFVTTLLLTPLQQIWTTSYFAKYSRNPGKSPFSRLQRSTLVAESALEPCAGSVRCLPPLWRCAASYHFALQRLTACTKLTTLQVSAPSSRFRLCPLLHAHPATLPQHRTALKLKMLSHSLLALAGASSALALSYHGSPNPAVHKRNLGAVELAGAGADHLKRDFFGNEGHAKRMARKVNKNLNRRGESCCSVVHPPKELTPCCDPPLPARVPRRSLLFRPLVRGMQLRPCTVLRPTITPPLEGTRPATLTSREAFSLSFRGSSPRVHTSAHSLNIAAKLTHFPLLLARASARLQRR